MLADKLKYFLETSAPILFQEYNVGADLSLISEQFDELAIAYLATMEDSYPILTTGIANEELQRWGPYWELLGPYVCADTNEFIVGLALRSVNTIYLHASYIPRTHQYIVQSN
ncbi:hypothetical protein FLM48_13950 [Shewanella sp. Scap07]|uniref:hypothetical protein n=1 Tax=Shewanella sp. Scap07 TaxID=2589987 RepID=UPI0015BEA601|nr:hypothetical protein [Shewanella sp. Scap07]QLE86069.1 hypothetical protein FLM48_13950 [Shewanella sp. Scap07]